MQQITLISDEQLNTLICASLSYVIIIQELQTFTCSQFLAPPVCKTTLKYTQSKSTAKGVFIATQLNSTRRRVVDTFTA